MSALHLNLGRLRRAGIVSVGLLAASTALVLPAAGQPDGSPTITIDNPAAGGQPQAGTVTLTGAVDARSNTTSVLYLIDATNSTDRPTGGDCNGDGTAGDAGDDLNGDGAVGDTLDCEIGGVAALDHSLAGARGTQVGLIAFANLAQTANLSSTGTATFVPPDQAGLVTAAHSVVRNAIGLYTPKDLGGSGAGTAFNNAVQLALSTMAAAGPGPKQVMFLTDGLAPLSAASIAAVHDSGVKWRSFTIGTSTSCSADTGPAKLAAATGDTCTAISSPAGLAAKLTGSQPDTIQGVTATIDGVSVKATVNSIGGWRAPFSLSAGTYTATATATMTSGAVVSAQRTFTVGASGPGGPVGVPTGTRKGTAVHVRRPASTRLVGPPRVTGWVGKPGRRTVHRTPALTGAKVRLEGRAKAGAAWTTVAHAKVSHSGAYVLHWTPKKRLPELRVVLRSFRAFGSSAGIVPPAPISHCTITSGASRWSATCHTTAAQGKHVRVLERGAVVARSRVHHGLFTVHASGRPAGHTLVIDLSRTRHLRLAL